jgi:hypothetical protein
MRLITLAVLSSFALLLSTLGSSSWGEPVKQPEISFSLAYYCSSDKEGKIRQFENFYLADSLEKGLNVVLVSKKGSCSGKTGDRFTEKYEPEPGDEFERTITRLTGKENCPGADGKDSSRIAIVGVDSSEAHIVEPKNDKSLLSKDMESKARKIASAAYRAEGFPDAADFAPDVFIVGKTALLLFKSTDESLNGDGLPVIVFNNNAFELDGTCAWSPFFLSVKEKIYLAYWATVGCCCGQNLLLVYDLSGESPKFRTILP